MRTKSVFYDRPLPTKYSNTKDLAIHTGEELFTQEVVPSEEDAKKERETEVQHPSPVY